MCSKSTKTLILPPVRQDLLSWNKPVTIYCSSIFSIKAADTIWLLCFTITAKRDINSTAVPWHSEDTGETVQSAQNNTSSRTPLKTSRKTVIKKLKDEQVSTLQNTSKPSKTSRNNRPVPSQKNLKDEQVSTLQNTSKTSKTSRNNRPVPSRTPLKTSKTSRTNSPVPSRTPLSPAKPQGRTGSVPSQQNLKDEQVSTLQNTSKTRTISRTNRPVPSRTPRRPAKPWGTTGQYPPEHL